MDVSTRAKKHRKGRPTLEKGPAEPDRDERWEKQWADLAKGESRVGCPLSEPIDLEAS
jgi:hypothetical protein